MVTGIIAGLGLAASFRYDVATGGAMVLISISLFLVCVALKKIIGSGPAELPKAVRRA